MQINDGWLDCADQSPCDHFDSRPDTYDISLLVIHNISLPPGMFGGSHIQDFFAGQLDPQAHPFFQQICAMRVSSHLLIRRDGNIVQFVPFHQRAWHAGLSSFQGRSCCNDYSIGIEMEGTDEVAYTNEQYQALIKVTKCIMATYPAITLANIVGHNDIAPGRKTDPGHAFDWCYYRQRLN
ncbi:1,6-anhydro-N-acetylmuramyl-L-alanine amidase AmpD [Aliiglaciecola litoralis]|uniref:1,6-anhydro-N-acetylmuramyl-L-alanine amidase AmpD n=1 Tax=Aliiglaciecola litoralis TaxID=582857 RepID=A0ABN1LQP0_9ALTE